MKDKVFFFVKLTCCFFSDPPPPSAPCPPPWFVIWTRWSSWYRSFFEVEWTSV